VREGIDKVGNRALSKIRVHSFQTGHFARIRVGEPEGIKRNQIKLGVIRIRILVVFPNELLILALKEMFSLDL